MHRCASDWHKVITLDKKDSINYARRHEKLSYPLLFCFHPLEYFWFLLHSGISLAHVALPLDSKIHRNLAIEVLLSTQERTVTWRSLLICHGKLHIIIFQKCIRTTKEHFEIALNIWSFSFSQPQNNLFFFFFNVVRNLRMHSSFLKRLNLSHSEECACIRCMLE